MKTIPLASLSLIALVASARAGGEKAVIDTPEKEPSRWRIGAAYAPIFGLDAKFSGLGNYASAFPSPVIAPGTDRNYDDGFVHVDSSGNIDGETWNWGYDEASQVDGTDITMSLTSSNADASARESDETAQGVDLFAYYSIGTVPLGGKQATWGLRAGLHYGRVDLSNNSSISSSTTILRDTYSLASGFVPGAPYSGSFNGPGPRVDDTPIRDFDSGSALVSGSRDLDVHLTTLNLGAWLEIPATERFSFALEGGFSAALASGDYDFRSSTTITGLGTADSSGSDSDTKVLPGLYLGLSSAWQINASWAIQLSGRYQYLEDFSLKDNGSEANLDFGSAFILSAGVVDRF